MLSWLLTWIHDKVPNFWVFPNTQGWMVGFFHIDPEERNPVIISIFKSIKNLYIFLIVRINSVTFLTNKSPFFLFPINNSSSPVWVNLTTSLFLIILIIYSGFGFIWLLNWVDWEDMFLFHLNFPLVSGSLFRSKDASFYNAKLEVVSNGWTSRLMFFYI